MTDVVSDTSQHEVVIQPPARRGSGALRWGGQVLSWFVMLSIGSMLLLAVVIPRIVGGSSYTVETGSMRPGLPPGTLVVDKAPDPASVAVGDVITFQLSSGDPAVVTHRVIAIGYDGAGEVHWQTQGDANNVADANWVVADQLRGEVWYSVPLLGRVSAMVGNQQRGLLVGLIALGLGGYAIAQFRGAWHDRRRKQQGSDVSA